MSRQPTPAILDAFNANPPPMTWPEYAATRPVSRFRRALDRWIFGDLPPPLPPGYRHDFVFGE